MDLSTKFIGVRPARHDRLREGKRWWSKRAEAAVAVAAGVILCIASLPSCLAQTGPEPSLDDYLPPKEPEMSRDAWQQRIEEARRRASEVARERREHPELYMQAPRDPAVVATERRTQ